MRFHEEIMYTDMRADGAIFTDYKTSWTSTRDVRLYTFVLTLTCVAYIIL